MDARRRYLQQLIELGETELVLEGDGVRARGRVVAEEGGGRARGRAGAEQGGGLARGRVPADAGLRPDSARLGARRTAPSPAAAGPTMYPPGLAVEAPPARGDLFSADPIAALDSLDALAKAVAECRKCPLGHSRLNAVPGEGEAHARLVCVGEAPGATEDDTGRPFVGRAGKLLDDILRAVGLEREAVFICNVLKCRPPDNRTPEPLEVAACSPYLHRQLELIRPKVILALGKPAANTLLGTNASLGDMRGKVHRYRGIPLVVSYHPAALLRNPNWKPATWDDVRIARRLLDGEAV